MINLKPKRERKLKVDPIALLRSRCFDTATVRVTDNTDFIAGEGLPVHYSVEYGTTYRKQLSGSIQMISVDGKDPHSLPSKLHFRLYELVAAKLKPQT